MYLLVIFNPLFSSLLVLFTGRYLGKFTSIFFSNFLILWNFFLSLFLFYEVSLAKTPCFLSLFSWIEVGVFNIEWNFMFDVPVVLMLLIINFISLMVHFYSISYMQNDPHLTRFMSYLSLFTFFMIILVTSGNFFQMFLGWEGVGLASYLLINFWFTRIKANKSAIKAMIVNRIGDFGLCLSFFLIFFYFKSLDYCLVFSLVDYFSFVNFFFIGLKCNLLDLISFLLFIGVMGKSAQLGLHTWLPDAMEGPTPVSALIHAATMVTAGVFLLIRVSPILEYTYFSLNIIAFIGSLTAFFASVVAAFQNDIKKIIAYSTCSQLGYMVFACGLSAYTASMFHLFNHAFFKALLFLGAGSVIHALSDEQDLRKMGGLLNFLPVTYISFLIGSLSLSGFPFLTGYYSKDFILEFAYGTYSFVSIFSYCLGLAAAYFTVFYSLKIIWLVFFFRPNFFKFNLKFIHESSFYMLLPLLLLSVSTIFIGYTFREAMIGFGTNFWLNSVFLREENLILFEIDFIPIYLKIFPFLIFFFSILTYFIFNSIIFNKCYFHVFYITLYRFFNRKWYFDLFYNLILKLLLYNFSYRVCYKVIDKGLLEFLGPYLLDHLVFLLNMLVSLLHSLILNYYIFIAILFISIYVIEVNLTPHLVFLFPILLIAYLFDRINEF